MTVPIASPAEGSTELKHATLLPTDLKHLSHATVALLNCGSRTRMIIATQAKVYIWLAVGYTIYHSSCFCKLGASKI